jgi:hypothetical protein
MKQVGNSAHSPFARVLLARTNDQTAWREIEAAWTADHFLDELATYLSRLDGADTGPDAASGALLGLQLRLRLGMAIADRDAERNSRRADVLHACSRVLRLAITALEFERSLASRSVREALALVTLELRLYSAPAKSP